MGAGCSNGRALAVQDSVTRKITLTQTGQEHLKNFASNPETSGRLPEQSCQDESSYEQSKRNNFVVLEPKSFMEDVNQSRVSIEKTTPSRLHYGLWDAVETNDIKLAEDLLDKISQEQSQVGESDLYDSFGNSMAHKAASLGHAEILMLLLERTGAKPDLVNSQLSTPLHLACKNNRESVAKFLIGCGVDINGQDEHGQTPLLICCIHGNIELAQLIIEASAAGHTPELLEIDMRDHRGLTPLNCAAIKGDMKLAKLLIEKAQASVEVASPKGCTPVIYAARGGYDELLQYLILQCKASPLKQDNSGATLFHHAIEKAQMGVLQMCLRIGSDFLSAVEIADNAGRTPLFEAIDNNAPAELVRLLLTKRSKKAAEGGFGMNANVLSYNGQTPLFSAVREGNLDLIKVLIEFGGAEPDLNNGEMIKDDSEEGATLEECESVEERNFMDAYKNCMTPLHLACILGQDDIAIYLTDRAQANPNLQTNIKGYASLHLAVLANKPEMLIELLTRTNANPNIPDYSGRTFIEMVEAFIPSYHAHFESLLENLQMERLKRAEQDSQSQLLVATHYYNPDDDREIKGFKDPVQDLEKHIEEQLQQDEGAQLTEPEEGVAMSGQGEVKQGGALTQKKFIDMDDGDIEIEEGKNLEKDIEAVFGRKIALGMIAVNFKFKEIAVKIILKHAEKILSPGTTNDSSFNINEFVRACAVAIDLTCKEKVIKVFNHCLQLLNLLITSPKVESSVVASDNFKRVFTERSITLKLLQRSEEGNTRLTNKIHECLLDYSFHPRIGEAHVSSFILQRIISHNKTASSTQKPPLAPEQSRNLPSEGALGSYKGLLAQLALLYKFVNSFGVSAKKRGPLNANDIVNAILPSLTHSSQDVRSASTKILLDVQRLSGAVKEEKFINMPEKQRNPLLEKLRAQVIEREQNQAMIKGDTTLNGGDESIQDENDAALGGKQYSGPEDEEQKDSAATNWTGSKDQSLKSLLDALTLTNSKSTFTDDFLSNSTVLLKSCLEDNNMNLYLHALDVAAIFFAKCLFTEFVLGSLGALIKPIVLRTNDTNTRMRKRSVEVINQVWSQVPPQVQMHKQGHQSESEQHTSVPSIIAEVICDQTLLERAIIGRLGLFIKRAQVIDGISADDELSKKPHQVILGRNYEQLTEFACLWCIHKNTKVRQNALKLIVEICRVNSLDQRGMPFKQRIINMILQLRASLRDPLVAKINEVCSSNGQQYIDVTELELNLATSKSSNKRAQSLDVRVRNNTRPSSNGTALPEIGTSSGSAPRNSVSNESMLPSVGGAGQHISLSAAQQQIILPHSEPLTEEQKTKAAALIELFSLDLMTCFYSQFWANRFAAIEKVEEQLHNLDPNRRDAMSCEINRKNLPIEEIFKVFLEFIDEGTKDPVLKNLIGVIDLLKKSLPTFFRYIQPATVRKELMPLVSSMIKKTTDLKAKVREVIVEFCLYLSHQSVIGPEIMVNAVLVEVEQILTDATAPNASNVATNMGNSHMISSCFKMLNSFQLQSKLLDKTLKTFPGQQQIYNRFLAVINSSLRHSNPQVRKEGETLFKTLYGEFGERLDSLLVNQKPQLLTKLLTEAKQEHGLVDGEKQQEINVQRAQSMIRTEMLSQSTLGSILKGQEENLQALKGPNAKKRLNAVVEIRKAVQKELVTVQGNPKTARGLFEPLSMLIRQLLADEEPDIYMETLGMLRAVVGALVPHMSTLDVHLMLGSFIGVIVANTVSGNIRTQISSDKVIIFFAKHSNIGPFVVAKDILKNIEKCIKAVQVVTKRDEQLQVLQDKKATILRFLSILQLLLQHFSIVLCYQAEFYDKCIEIIADSLIVLAQEDQGIKNLCIQIVVNLHKIDAKLLEQTIQKMDFSRKTPLRKAMIELENQSRAGKSVITQDHHAFANNVPSASGNQSSGSNMVPASPMATIGHNKDTRGSNNTASSRTSLFSPGTTLRGASPGGANLAGANDWSRKSIEGGLTPTHQPYIPTGLMNSTQGSNNGGVFKTGDSRVMRRMISLENENPRGSQTFSNPMGATTLLQSQNRQSVFKEDATELKRDLVLPDIMAPKTTLQPLGSTTNTSHNRGYVPSMMAAPKMSLQSIGGAGFNSSAMTPIKAQNSSDQNTNNNNGGIRPPLYVPQKRDAGRAATGMLSGSGMQSTSNGLPASGQPVTLLNRTGPLPSTYVPPGESKEQSANPVGASQFKTEFNSNLYSNASTSGTSSNMGVRSGSLQKKQIAPLGGSNLFKAMPQAPVTFETNVTRYKETTTTPSGANKGLGELF